MTQRERLVELLTKTFDEQYEKARLIMPQYTADHLIANEVVVPPCKVGDEVFFVHDMCDENANEYPDISVGNVVSFSIQTEGLWAYCRYDDGLTYWHLVADDFGKTVFLSREEAEGALRGGVE